MWTLARTLIYASGFIGLLLVFLPARVLSASGIAAAPSLGPRQVAGLVLALAGAALTATCILTFAFAGKGTPAPFDPPRRLVVRGPYKIVRNPMYLGAGLLLTGAAAYYGSTGLVLYAAAFLLAMHGFVVLYEEPTLHRMFGADYDAYCASVGRWWPKRLFARLTRSV